jgi:hypothetical protein
VENTARVEALVQDRRTELVQRNEMLYAALEEVRRHLEMLRR